MKKKLVFYIISGVIMQVSERGTGIYGCGLPIENGVVKFEAMRWMLSVLNQRSGSSFLPGISIGKLVTRMNSSSSSFIFLLHHQFFILQGS
jgi:hypothetical protein